MEHDWFTETGATGSLTIERRDDGWFVASPGTAGETKCLIDETVDLDESVDSQQVEVGISQFRRGTRSDVNFLSLTAAEMPPQESSDPAGKSGTYAQRSSTRRGENSSAPETWDLTDFCGSGEYVDVEATVDAVFFVKKDESNMPDMKGELTDDSVLNPIVFIVEDGVSHPYLGEGNRFRFENVKDHYYKDQAEVQILINSNTSFVELE